MACSAGLTLLSTIILMTWSSRTLVWISIGRLQAVLPNWSVNKVILSFNGDHNDLKRQVRQGIAQILVDNILFGDDLGEFAANQALLDLPKWLVDGYVEYAAEPWGTTLDDDLKSALLSGRFKNFYQFAFERPELAGHSFWHYVAEKYKKENVTYFLYLARVYRNLNSASNRIAKKKFKDLLKDFMNEEEDRYNKDIRGRRNFPKGTVSVVEETKPGKDFIRFTANPHQEVRPMLWLNTVVVNIPW